MPSSPSVALVAEGQLSLATLVAFLLAVFCLTAPIASLAGAAMQLQEGLAAVVRLREVNALEIEDDVDLPVQVPAPRGPSATEIRIEDLSFSYTGRDPALRQVSMTIAANRVTTLVGPSGAGKSTLFALLLRFYDPDAGRIRLA